MQAAGREQRRDRRRAMRHGIAAALAGLALVCGGCFDSTPADQPAVDPATVTAPTDQLNSSELGLSMAMPRALRVAARSPEDHELRLAGRNGENQSLVGRLTLITREGRDAVMREAMARINDTWNQALFAQNLSDEPSFRPEVVADFHPPGEHGLTIIKKRLSARKPLPTRRDPESIDNEPNEVRILALAYFVVVEPTETQAAAVGTVGTPPVREKYLLAMFVLENTPQAERMVDEMVQSLRILQ